LNIPSVDISIYRFKPKHKYTFHVVAPTAQIHRLLTLAFGSDQSIYLFPQFSCDFTFCLLDKDARSVSCSQGESHKLSIHETGVLKFTSSSREVWLEKRTDPRQPVRHLYTVAVNQFDHLPTVGSTEFNHPKAKHINLLLVGVHFGVPIFKSVFCVRNDANWTPPILGNTLMQRYVTQLRDRDYKYHFIIWQNTNAEKGLGDIAFSFG
jgi:hypothetical protein